MGEYDFDDSMLRDPPVKGDMKYNMCKTHGSEWCAWQELWLDGLRALRDRRIYSLCGFDEFKKKFESDIELDTSNCNTTISFDASYELGDEVARNILDWERRHMLIESQKRGKGLTL